MGFPAVPVFLVLLAAYTAYSWWSSLDPRYPLFAAFALLLLCAGLAAVGQLGVANTVAVFVFLLLGSGVLLMLMTLLRERRRARPSAGHRAPGEVTGEPPHDRDLAPEHPLDGLEQEPVADIEAPRDEDHDDEQ